MRLISIQCAKGGLMMEKFYEGSLITSCFPNEQDALEFLHEYFNENLSKCFIAIFDPEVNKWQMQEEITESVKLNVGQEEC